MRLLLILQVFSVLLQHSGQLAAMTKGKTKRARSAQFSEVLSVYPGKENQLHPRTFLCLWFLEPVGLALMWCRCVLGPYSAGNGWRSPCPHPHAHSKGIQDTWLFLKTYGGPCRRGLTQLCEHRAGSPDDTRHTCAHTLGGTERYSRELGISRTNDSVACWGHSPP